MVAIFDNEQAAQTFAESVEAYLRRYRERYDAERWAVPYKHPGAERWAVPMPPEPMDPPQDAALVEQLADDWYPARPQ